MSNQLPARTYVLRTIFDDCRSVLTVVDDDEEGEVLPDVITVVRDGEIFKTRVDDLVRAPARKIARLIG